MLQVTLKEILCGDEDASYAHEACGNFLVHTEHVNFLSWANRRYLDSHRHCTYYVRAALTPWLDSGRSNLPPRCERYPQEQLCRHCLSSCKMFGAQIDPSAWSHSALPSAFWTTIVPRVRGSVPDCIPYLHSHMPLLNDTLRCPSPNSPICCTFFISSPSRHQATWPGTSHGHFLLTRPCAAFRAVGNVVPSAPRDAHMLLRLMLAEALPVKAVRAQRLRRQGPARL